MANPIIKIKRVNVNLPGEKDVGYGVLDTLQDGELGYNAYTNGLYIGANGRNHLLSVANSNNPDSQTFYGNVNGTATVASKLAVSKGDANTPVYFKDGIPTVCTGLDLNTSGKAGSADKWTTPRKISISSSAGDTETLIDGSADKSLIIPKSLTGFTSITSDTFVGNLTGTATVATKLNTNAGSKTNPIYFTNGVPTPCDTTLEVSITGNSETATKWATPRTITISETVGGTAPSVDGSANIILVLPKILSKFTSIEADTFKGNLTGTATAASKLSTNAGDSNTPVYFLNGVPVACEGLDLDTTGNAATATKLKTGRSLSISGTAGTSGTTFDGSADKALILPKTLTGFTEITATTFTGTLSGNASSSSKVYSTVTNHASGFTYGVPFHTGYSTSENKSLLQNDGFKYWTREGTSSLEGVGELVLGNATSVGTAGNKSGWICLYGQKNYYVEIMPNSDMTSHISLYLPAGGGRLARVTDNVESATSAKCLTGWADNRSVNTTPNTYNNLFLVSGLKYNASINSPDDSTYSGVIGFRSWSDFSGGNAHELAFTGNGNIYHRHGATTSWNSWNKLLNSSGGTLTGALNLANGTWNKSGDDAQFGDNNTAGSFAIQGLNGTTNLKMVTYNGTTYGTLAWDGNNFALSNSLAVTGYLTASENIAAEGYIRNGYHYQLPPVYNYTSGCLIQLCATGAARMITLRITGNSYTNDIPINSVFQFYDYNTSTDFYFPSGTHYGHDFGKLTVYRYNGYTYAWFKQTNAYQTFNIEIISMNSLTPTVTNSAAHSSGYSNYITITPKKALLEKVVTLTGSTIGNSGKWIKCGRFNLPYAYSGFMGLLAFNAVEGGYRQGILSVYIRNGADTTTTSYSLNWLTLNATTYDNVALVKVSNGVFDMYYKAPGDWDTMRITYLSGGNPAFLALENGGSWVSSISAVTTSTLNGCVYYSSIAGKLQTARTINGTSFDGSANITTANWGTSRTISISSTAGTTGTSVNGSANASLIIPKNMTGFNRIEISSSDNTVSPVKQNLVLNGVNGNTTTALAPGIGFHIGNVSWGSLKFDNGTFKFFNSDCSGYMPVALGALTATGNITCGNYFSVNPSTNNGGFNYKGRADVGCLCLTNTNWTGYGTSDPESAGYDKVTGRVYFKLI